MSETQPEASKVETPPELAVPAEIDYEQPLFPGRFGFINDGGIQRLAMIVENPEGPGLDIHVFEATHKSVPYDNEGKEGTFKPMPI